MSIENLKTYGMLDNLSVPAIDGILDPVAALS
jgi:hypothetical protein